MMPLILAAGGFHEPFEPDPECRYPGLVIVGLCLVAWVAFIGAGYALYRAAEALIG